MCTTCTAPAMRSSRSRRCSLPVVLDPVERLVDDHGHRAGEGHVALAGEAGQQVPLDLLDRGNLLVELGDRLVEGGDLDHRGVVLLARPVEVLACRAELVVGIGDGALGGCEILGRGHVGGSELDVGRDLGTETVDLGLGRHSATLDGFVCVGRRVDGTRQRRRRCRRLRRRRGRGR